MPSTLSSTGADAYPTAASTERQESSPSRLDDRAALSGDVLPSCFLLAILLGFGVFVLSGQAIVPALFAAGAGALLGLFFASE
jgi:hypothetical protein